MKVAFCCAEDINLGAGYVISYLKQQGHDVRLFFDPKQFERGYCRVRFLKWMFSIRGYIVRNIVNFNPDITCFSCVTANYKWALSLAEEIKEKLPKTKIIFGGVHPTLVPDEVRKHKFIDEVVENDGIEYFGGTFDPDKIFPDREIFLKELPPEHRRIQLFMTGVGCPFNCSYCGNEQLRKLGKYKFKRRSVEGCIKELRLLKEHGAKYILFVDDIFTINVGWLGDFLKKYKKEIDLPFSCFVHPKFVSTHVVSLLKSAGCQSAWLGIQTGHENLRRDILNRPETNKEIIAACKMIKDANIKLIVDHIFGIPFESELSQDISQALYEKIKPDIINCYQLLYFPKSGIIKHALKCGYLKPTDVEKIERGEGIVYQTNNKGQYWYDTYLKAFIVIPLGGIGFEFLPVWLIKIINLCRAGRAFTIRAIVQNELFFAYRAILKKVGLWNLHK